MVLKITNTAFFNRAMGENSRCCVIFRIHNDVGKLTYFSLSLSLGVPCRPFTLDSVLLACERASLLRVFDDNNNTSEWLSLLAHLQQDAESAPTGTYSLHVGCVQISSPADADAGKRVPRAPASNFGSYTPRPRAAVNQSRRTDMRDRRLRVSIYPCPRGWTTRRT